MDVLITGTALGAALIGYGWVFRRAGWSVKSPLVLVFYLLPPVAASALIAFQRGTTPRLDAWDAFIDAAQASVFGALAYAIFVYGYNAHVDDRLLREDRKARIERMERRNHDEERRRVLRRRIEVRTSPAFFAVYIFLGLGAAGVILARKVTEWMLL